MTDRKVLRQDKIKEIIENNMVNTQDELVKRLNEEGFDVTQATVSRDIRELQLAKVATELGGFRYRVPENTGTVSDKKYVRILKEAVLSLEAAENILVIKTVSGMAMAAAAALDSLKIPKVVGCIAGDDTIMCIVKTVSDVK
ncbi:MAG: arginine repressor, partial [Lachnospiraceae bacterium]|nr:arginine repressor [Lachnospiraceae bacterium]